MLTRGVSPKTEGAAAQRLEALVSEMDLKLQRVRGVDSTSTNFLLQNSTLFLQSHF